MSKSKKEVKKFGMGVKERGDHLLQVMGTIIIAILLLILFKDQIINVFDNALTKTSTAMEQLFESGSESSSP